MSDMKVLTMPFSINELKETLENLKGGSLIILGRKRELVYYNLEVCRFLGYQPGHFERMNTEEWLRFKDSHALMIGSGGESIRSQVYRTILKTEVDNGEWELVVLRDLPQKRKVSLLHQFSGTFMKDVNLGILLISVDFVLLDISDMACRILGMDKEKVLNQPIEQIFAGVPEEHQLVQRTLLDGLAVRNHAVSWTNAEERFELLMDSNLLTDDDGTVLGAYVIFKDVSNLRSLEEQVQRSDRLAMIGQIAAGTAHEIRNPLTSLKGFLQILKKTLTESNMEKELGYTEIMLSEIDRINGLVSEFLLLSKPRDSTYNKVDISAVFQDILPIINNEAILHNVTIEYNVKNPIPEVIADQELLKQVYLNICKNGIEAMGEEGRLVIWEEVDYENRKVSIHIQDTGPGIPAFLIDKIFDPFFTTKEKGIGLGLSVCQRIIHDMGGSIQVRSKGFGTTFSIFIPF